MEDTTNLYSRFMKRVRARAFYQKYVIAEREKGERAEYIFGIDIREDELHNEVIKAVEKSAQQEIEWLFIQLCMEYGYPVESMTGNGKCSSSNDIVFEKDGEIIQVDFKSVLKPDDLRVYQSDKKKQSQNSRHPPTRKADTYLVYLLKKTPAGDAWIEVNSNPEVPVKVVLAYDFIAEVFGVEEAQRFDAAMENFSKEMRKELGYSMTKIGSERALDELREALAFELKEFDYFAVKRANSEMFPMGAVIDSTLFRKIQQRFNFNCELLLGHSDFAVAFLTSEWLQRQDNALVGADYTYIATGYFKSAEQLIWDILLQICPDGYIGRDTTKISEVNPKTNDSALGSLCFFFNNSSNNKLFNNDFEDDKDTVRECLAYYLNEWARNTRNGYFHKHNLDIKDIADIREKTFLLYFLILGSLALNKEQRTALMG